MIVQVCAVENRDVPVDSPSKDDWVALMTNQGLTSFGVTLSLLLREGTGRGPVSKRTDSDNNPTPVTPALTKSACSPARSLIGFGN